MFSFRENGLSDVFLLEFLESLRIVSYINSSFAFSRKFGTQSPLSFSVILFCNAYHSVHVCCAEIKEPGTTPQKMVSQTKSSKNLLPLILTYWRTMNSVRRVALWLRSKWPGDIELILANDKRTKPMTIIGGKASVANN